MEFFFKFRLFLTTMPVFMSFVLATIYGGAQGSSFSGKEFNIPLNLINHFKERSKYLHNIQDQQFGHLQDSQFAVLPSAFLALLPETYLSKVKSSKLARIIKKHPNDAFLATHITSAVKLSNHKLEFIEEVSGINTTSVPVQRILAAAVIDMLLGDKLQINETLLTPFVLHLPASYLLQLNDSEIQKILYNLPEERQGYEVSKLELRLLAKLSLKDDIYFRRVDWLITGLSEEELEELSITSLDFKPDFSIIQARAVFQNVYSNKTLDGTEMVECAVLQPKLTPLMLQRFPTHMETFSVYNLLPSPKSVATAKQILEIIVSNSMDKKKLTENRHTWSDRIAYLKNWVYALPVSVLRQYSQFTTLKSAALAQIQSDLLTDLQAYHLTSKGQTMKLNLPTSVMDMKTLLSALPTTELMAHSVGEINSNIMEHLLIHLPGKNIPRMVSLLANIIHSFDSRYFPTFLQNKDVSIYFNLISSKHIRHCASDIESHLKIFNDIQRANFQQLPPKVLSVLLRTQRQDKIWTLENFPLLLINGINCEHINNIATTDFIPIMAYYNKQRENFKQVFPKNLQYCCLQKLIEYLQLKMELQSADIDEGLISLLSPAEIVAIGGYVLLGLPLEAIEANKHQTLILSTIGKLSVAELLLASDIYNLQKLATLATKQMFSTQFADFFELGNLVWFVPPDSLANNFKHIFKLALESQILDKRLCMHSSDRSLWAEFIVQTFGPPEYWSSGVLNTLGGSLIVFSEDTLLKVPEISWINAVDTLEFNYSHPVEWAKPMPFYKVCLAAIKESEKDKYISAIKQLVRWQLWAAESQLNTIRHAPNTSKSEIKMFGLISNAESIESSIIVSEDDNYDDYDSNKEYETYEDSLEETTTYSTKYEDITTTQVNEYTTIVTINTLDDETTTNVDNSETEKYQKSTSQAIESSTNEITTENSNNLTVTTDAYDSTLTTQSDNYIELNKTGNDFSIDQTSNIEATTKTQRKHTKQKTTIAMEAATEPTKNELKEDMRIINESTSTMIPQIINKIEEQTTSSDISDRNMKIKVEENVSKVTKNVTNKIKTNTQEKINSEILDDSIKISRVKVEENSITTNVTKKVETNITLPLAEYRTDSNLHSNISGKYFTNNEEIINSPSSTVSSSTSTEDADYKDFQVDSASEVMEDNENETIFENNGRRRREVQIKQYNFTFSCDAIKMVGKAAELYLSSEDIDNKNFNQTELNECADMLGMLDLPNDVVHNIWGRLDRNTKEPFHLMGNLLNAVSYRDISEKKLKLEEPWTLETISEISQYINNTYLILTLVDEIKKRHFEDEFTVETLAAFRNIICWFDRENLPQLEKEFHHIVVLLGTTPWCLQCVSRMAEIAVSASGFNDIGSWEVEDVVTMGSVVAGLNDTQWEELLQSPKNLVAGLQPQAIQCLSEDKLKAINEKLPLLPPLTLASISTEQLALLTPEQRSVIQDVKDLKINVDIMPKMKEISAAAIQCSVSKLFIFIIIIYVLQAIYI